MKKLYQKLTERYSFIAVSMLSLLTVKLFLPAYMKHITLDSYAAMGYSVLILVLMMPIGILILLENWKKFRLPKRLIENKLYKIITVVLTGLIITACCLAWFVPLYGIIGLVALVMMFL